MHDQFMVPMQNSLSIVTLTDQTHKISGSRSDGVLNFIWGAANIWGSSVDLMVPFNKV